MHTFIRYNTPDLWQTCVCYLVGTDEKLLRYNLIIEALRSILEKLMKLSMELLIAYTTHSTLHTLLVNIVVQSWIT